MRSFSSKFGLIIPHYKKIGYNINVLRRTACLKLHSATKINLHGVSDSAFFRDHLKVSLSPLKSPVLRNSRSKYRISVVYPFISKCNAKRCSYCKH